MNPLAVQTAIFGALSADATLDGLLARSIGPSGTETSSPAIYDHVPDAVDNEDPDSDHYPYVAIGDDTNIDFNTDTTLGGEVTVTLHVWSRFRGRSETKEIQSAIYDALNRADLVITGRHTVDVYCEYMETILDQDGITRHGVMRFRLIHEED